MLRKLLNIILCALAVDAVFLIVFVFFQYSKSTGFDLNECLKVSTEFNISDDCFDVLANDAKLKNPKSLAIMGVFINQKQDVRAGDRYLIEFARQAKSFDEFMFVFNNMYSPIELSPYYLENISNNLKNSDSKFHYILMQLYSGSNLQTFNMEKAVSEVALLPACAIEQLYFIANDLKKHDQKLIETFKISAESNIRICEKKNEYKDYFQKKPSDERIKEIRNYITSMQSS